MKKWMALFMGTALALGLLSGCAEGEPTGTTDTPSTTVPGTNGGGNDTPPANNNTPQDTLTPNKPDTDASKDTLKPDDKPGDAGKDDPLKDVLKPDDASKPGDTSKSDDASKPGEDANKSGDAGSVLTPSKP